MGLDKQGIILAGFWVVGGTKGICEVMLNSLIQIVFLLYTGSFASYVSLQEHLTG